jgi:hypothetical protein
MSVAVEQLNPTRGKAVVEITRRGRDEEIRSSGLIVHHTKENKGYSVDLDWERGTIVALGPNTDWTPLTIGSEVIVQAPSGGMAGADVSATVGRRRGEVVIVDVEEIVCNLEE